jgi:hypothetical protein
MKNLTQLQCTLCLQRADAAAPLPVCCFALLPLLRMMKSRRRRISSRLPILLLLLELQTAVM